MKATKAMKSPMKATPMLSPSMNSLRNAMMKR